MTPNANASTISAGTAVRTALDANSAFSTYQVQVEPTGDHLVLKGEVNDKAAKKAVAEAAKAAAGDVRIDNQITVKKSSQ